MTLSENLQWRGFVNQTTYKDLRVLDGAPITFYLGVDPSSDSMTVGNLAIVMMVRHFIEAGHKAILLVGGATGMIGDPDGKQQERDLLTLDQISHNKQRISAQYQQILAGLPFDIVDNYEWFEPMGYLAFLRDVGKHVPMRQMLARDFVQTRLGETGSGISYAEFSYALIQGYDFVYLHREKGVSLQVCGSDQWGNSIAGVELIRRMTGHEAHVWSAPLVVNKSTGKKFGKSEAGAIWLDEAKTSVYKFYQFWLNIDDNSAEDYLKLYTLLARDDIARIQQEFESNRGGRAIQKALAYEVTRIVHGQSKADSAVRTTATLFGSQSYGALTTQDFDFLKNELPIAHIKVGSDVVAAVVETGLAASNGEARRSLEQRSIYLNGVQIGPDYKISREDRMGGGYAVLRRGKNIHAILQITE